MDLPKQFNPFTEKTAGEYFVGRESALQQFSISLNGLTERVPSHIYVAGVHGTGKTSFLQKLSELSRENGFLGLVLNLDERPRGYDHIAKILRSIVSELEERLRVKYGNSGRSLTSDWERGKASSLFYHPRTDQIESDYIHKDFLRLRSVMDDAGVPGAVVCIDEGQRITPDALSALKNALQSVDRYLVIISLRLVQDKGSAVGSGRALLDEKAREAEGDFGASRFFVNGVPMGPFETEQEASECIRRRLEGNTIQFDDEVINAIAKFTDRIPREMISFSSQLYNNAAQVGEVLVRMPLLNETFAAVNRVDYRQAQALCSAVSAFERRVLKSLLSFRRPATPDDILRQFGDVPEQAREPVLSGLSGALDRIQRLYSVCQRTDDGFEVKGPIHRYALELALEATMI